MSFLSTSREAGPPGLELETSSQRLGHVTLENAHRHSTTSSHKKLASSLAQLCRHSGVHFFLHLGAFSTDWLVIAWSKFRVFFFVLFLGMYVRQPARSRAAVRL